MTDDVDPLIGTTLADRYRIVAKIGEGGAGRVYRAIQLQLEREVAIKVVRPDVPDSAKSELEARFFREAALAGRLSHPSIVQTIDYGTADGRQFVVMELLRGRTLRRALKGDMAPLEAARIGAAIARGLHHSHSKGLVHRDVKSANIFLVKDEEGVEHPKLLDFGLVKSVRRELDITQTPTYLGTPLYMSPEQARGELNVDGRSDLYSLGCLLYRMISGDMPYRGESAMATAFMHVSEPYPPMATKLSGGVVDGGLEAIVRRCMEKEPADRWPDGSELARALDAWRESKLAPAATDEGGGVLAAVMGAIGVLGVLGIGVGLLAVVAAIVTVGGVVYMARTPAKAPIARAPLISDAPDTPAEVVQVDPVEEPPAVDTDTDASEPSSVPDPLIETTAQAEPDPPAVRPGPPPTPSDAPSRFVGEDGSATDRGGAPAVRDPVVVAPPVESPPEPDGDGAWQPMVVDKYSFRSQAHASAALRFANSASRDELLAAKVSSYTLDAVLDNRPYASLQAFGATKGIGPSTMYAIATHTRP